MSDEPVDFVSLPDARLPGSLQTRSETPAFLFVGVPVATLNVVVMFSNPRLFRIERSCVKANNSFRSPEVGALVHCGDGVAHVAGVQLVLPVRLRRGRAPPLLTQVRDPFPRGDRFAPLLRAAVHLFMRAGVGPFVRDA